MTFVLDPTCFPHVFSSDAISFTAAVFPIVNKVGEFVPHFLWSCDPIARTAGVSIQEFSKYHVTVNEALKGRLSSTTAVLCPAMCREFHSSLCSHGYSGEKELMDFVQETMFASITRELFGRDTMPKKKVMVKETQHGLSLLQLVVTVFFTALCTRSKFSSPSPFCVFLLMSTFPSCS